MNRTLLAAALLLILTPAFTSTVVAQPEVMRKEQPNEISQLVTAYNSVSSYYNLTDEKEREALKAMLKDNEDLRAALKSYILKKIDDENIKRENAIRVVNKTNSAGSITFWIAHILLAVGVLMAALELWHAKKLRSKGKKESVEVEISLEKIALKSSVNGTLVLFVSLVFYFMYLKYVYPIIAL